MFINAVARRSIRWMLYAVAVLIFSLVSGHASGLSMARSNGFDLSNTLIPADQIHHRGLPRDGIPAVDAPTFVSAKDAHLQDEERVLGLLHKGYSKAYPLRILNYHEIVNDKLGGDTVVVTYCPLSGTGMAFAATIAGKNRSFGVSGLLYNTNVLLYDRQSESLWSQIMHKAVSGKLKGQVLKQLPLANTSWKDWRTRFPGSKVLSEHTDHVNNYNRSPYQNYDHDDQIWFPVSHRDHHYRPKELVIGLHLNGRTRVYPFAELARHGKVLKEHFAGQDLQIEFDAVNRTGLVRDERAQEVPSTIAYWFAWMTFFPDSEVFKSK